MIMLDMHDGYATGETLIFERNVRRLIESYNKTIVI